MGWGTVSPNPPWIFLASLRKGALLVDVRTREQIQSQTNGHIPQGAMVLPLDDWVGRVPPVMAGKKILLTCWKGNKSTLAWEALRAQFADAYVLDGGYNAWEAAGLATQSIWEAVQGHKDPSSCFFWITMISPVEIGPMWTVDFWCISKYWIFLIKVMDLVDLRQYASPNSSGLRHI